MAKRAVQYEALVALLATAGDTEECIEWSGRLDADGYGLCPKDGEKRAHRVAFVHASRQRIPAGACVLHSCDRRSCCNPKHLWLGSQQDNIADMIRKGRGPRLAGTNCNQGEAHGRARLTEQAVRDARRMAAGGAPHVEIARSFGVSRSSINDAINRTTWRHVE